MIVITGATGNVGQPLVELLAEAGHTVTAVSRGTSAPLPTRPGVTTAVADLSDVATLVPALESAEALFLLVSGAGAHVDGPALMKHAEAAGVRRVVLQSSQAVGTRPGAVSHAPLVELEEAVRSSGMEWTILRPGGFASNALAWVPMIKEMGAVHAPYADVALPAVDPLDIAEVAAAVLTEDGHAGRTYEITGPVATTPRERVAAIAAATGRPIELVELTPEEAHRQMSTFMPPVVVEGTLAILGQPTDAERAVSPHVKEVLGRPARRFEEWARRFAAAYA
ncbi:NAD(P)H-binding protein [Nocardioides sp. CCNWLW239]|uniref:NmrA family NAD(P)-binding protein n=1 Tax=Nocardioides sp. CCNWLW239 TaxID=3128902 RepID=UPI003018FA01